VDFCDLFVHGFLGVTFVWRKKCCARKDKFGKGWMRQTLLPVDDEREIAELVKLPYEGLTPGQVL
jgi:hypothetical protein